MVASIPLPPPHPLPEASRRGLGAAMLRKPRSLAKMVAGVVRESPLPVTVKVSARCVCVRARVCAHVCVCVRLCVCVCV